LIGGNLLYRIDVGNIQNVTASHIHAPATPTTTAGVALDFLNGAALSFTNTATLVSGVAARPRNFSLDSLMVFMRDGRAYVNVHTQAFGAGEIRGTVTRP
jgi:hypothetical protein